MIPLLLLLIIMIIMEGDAQASAARNEWYQYYYFCISYDEWRTFFLFLFLATDIVGSTRIRHLICAGLFRMPRFSASEKYICYNVVNITNNMLYNEWNLGNHNFTRYEVWKSTAVSGGIPLKGTNRCAKQQ